MSQLVCIFISFNFFLFQVWLEQALAVFSKTLKNKYESQLVLRPTSSYKNELLKLIKETGAKSVVWTALYEPYLVKRDNDIRMALESERVTVHEEHSYLLHRPDQVRFGLGFKVFN